MGTTKLKLWNDALAELGQPVLTATGGEDLNSLTLAENYDRTVLYCLEQGYWNHAISATSLATEGNVAGYGYTYPYSKPAGWLRTVRLSASSNYWPPLEDYEDTENKIQANVNPLYMAFVATGGGLALTTWPETFSTYVSCELASRICRRIGGAADEHEKMKARTERMKYDALSKDAMNEGVRYPPEGRWTLSRRGGSRNDRGNRGSLTG